MISISKVFESFSFRCSFVFHKLKKKKRNEKNELFLSDSDERAFGECAVVRWLILSHFKINYQMNEATILAVDAVVYRLVMISINGHRSIKTMIIN